MSQEHVIIQKIWKESHLDDILEYNLKNLSDWDDIYSNHESWIKRVIGRLKNDSYSRAVFGGFWRDEKKKIDRLCCSVIVKNNPFSSYLEIKNLVVFKEYYIKDDVIYTELKKNCQTKIITYIIRFAEYRGYPKLMIELSNRSKYDNDLIQLLLEHGFIIVGSQVEKYNNTHEIIFLSRDVERIYGLDPYDNISASNWILSNYLNCAPTTFEKAVRAYDTNRNTRSLYSSIVYTGYKFESGTTAAKFNQSSLVLVIPETFDTINKSQKKFGKISEILPDGMPISTNKKVFIFDFTEDADHLSSISDREQYTIFNRPEIEKLLGYKESENGRRRFSHNNVGGILLISDPKEFPVNRARQILANGKSPVYIKLGDYGRFLEEEMLIAFAYYTSDPGRSSIEIWGYGELSDEPDRIDISKEESSAKDIFTELNKEEEEEDDDDDENDDEQEDDDYNYSNDDSNENIRKENNNDFDDTHSRVIWKLADFQKHNAYNATNVIVCYSFEKLSVSSFVENKNGEISWEGGISLEKVLEDKNYIKDIDNVFDFYLSRKEATRIRKNFNLPEKNPSSNRVRQFTFQYLLAMPFDEHPFLTEWDNLNTLFQKHSQQIKSAPPVLESSLIKFNNAINTYPNIIHISCHGEEAEVLLKKKDGDAQHVSIHIMAELFKNVPEIQIIVFSVCKSTIIACEVSAGNRFAIGFNDYIEPQIADKLLRDFYEGLLSKKNNDLEKRIMFGYNNAAVNNPTHQGKMDLWNNKMKVDLNAQS